MTRDPDVWALGPVQPIHKASDKVSMSFKDDGGFRRKHPRRSFIRQVSLLHAGRYRIVVSGEIGEGGLSFRSSKKVEIGQVIVVNFRIPQGEFVSLRAEVKTIKDTAEGYLHGVSFQNIVFSHKRQIRSYVSSRSESESIIM